MDFAGFQVTERVLVELDAHESHDFVAEVGEHAADFAVLAFGQRNFKPAVLFAFAMEHNALGVHEFLALAEYAGRDVESCFHFRKVGCGRLARDLNAVDFQVGLLVDSIACGSRMTAGLTQ